MKLSFISSVLSLVCILTEVSAEVSFQAVAQFRQRAPETSNNVSFSQFSEVSLSDDGRIAFTANLTGTGVSPTNNLGLWAGLPNSLQLIARTGDFITVLSNELTVLTYIWSLILDTNQNVGFIGNHASCAWCSSLYLGIPFTAELASPFIVIPVPIYDQTIIPRSKASTSDTPFGLSNRMIGHLANVVALRAELFGPDTSTANNLAILSGPPGNISIAAQKASRAPGTDSNFISFDTSSGSLAVAPDGTLAFKGVAEGMGGLPGLWLGKLGAIQAIVLPRLPAPATLLGPGHQFNYLASENVALNAKGEVAFSASLTGPGLNNTNSDFLIAGTPDQLRVVAQSGQPAPGIPGATFQRYSGGSSTFGYVLLGSDGSVVFEASYSPSGNDFGLWFAPANGTPATLIMHTGRQAPGAPDGVVFTNSFQFLPPFEQVYMNGRNQIAFRSKLTGPGLDSSTYGVWIADPDGSVNLVARSGVSMDVGGTNLQPDNITFGTDPEFLAGPEDGHRTPFNDLGEIALSVQSQNPAVVIARTGLVISAEAVSNGVRIVFPTLEGKTYRVQYTSSLHPPAWMPLAESLRGTGGGLPVIDTNTAALDHRYYRVVRLD